MSAAIARALLERQELVDASAVEATIAQLVSREETSPGLSQPPSIGGDSVALGAMGQTALPRLPTAPPAPQTAEQTGTDSPPRRRPRRGWRARCGTSRCVTLKLQGFSTLERWIGTVRRGPRGRRSARCSTTSPTSAARASPGSRTTPRARSSGSWPTPRAPPPTRRGSRSTCTRRSPALPRTLVDSGASVRSASCAASPPASAIRRGTSCTTCSTSRPRTWPTSSGDRAPVGRDLGRRRRLPPGASRVPLGRRADARARRLAGRESARLDARSTRSNAPLTREERAAELALAPNDLVGRDAEKADLHAAYHRAGQRRPARNRRARRRRRDGHRQDGARRDVPVRAAARRARPARRVLAGACEVPFGASAISSAKRPASPASDAVRSRGGTSRGLLGRARAAASADSSSPAASPRS